MEESRASAKITHHSSQGSGDVSEQEADSEEKSRREYLGQAEEPEET